MKYKAIIHFVGGEKLTLHHLELEGENATERMSSFIEESGLQTARLFTKHYADTSLLISRDNITYVEIVEE